MAHMISWFELPVTDMDRAVAFYSEILQHPIPVEDMGPIKMGMLPGTKEEISGALVLHGHYLPSTTHGPLVYLNGGEDLSQILDRVEAAGGTITMPKTQISPEIGYMAIFNDVEGNRVGLFSQN